MLYNKKLPTIPPLLFDGKLVSDLCKKANIFNNFSAFICTPTDNTSCLFRTWSRVKSFHVTENYLLTIIKTLHSNKAHGCDNISIKMINICSQSLILPLKSIFEHSLKKDKFPEIREKATVVRVHKKKKMLVKRYRPTFRKMFERVICNSLFNYFQSNRLFTPS